MTAVRAVAALLSLCAVLILGVSGAACMGPRAKAMQVVNIASASASSGDFATSAAQFQEALDMIDEESDLLYLAMQLSQALQLARTQGNEAGIAGLEVVANAAFARVTQMTTSSASLSRFAVIAEQSGLHEQAHNLFEAAIAAATTPDEINEIIAAAQTLELTDVVTSAEEKLVGGDTLP